MCSALHQTHSHVLGLQTGKVLSVSETPQKKDQQAVEKTLSTVGVVPVPNMPNSQNSTCDEKKRKFFRLPRSRKGKIALIVDFLIFIIVVLLIALIEFGIFPEHKSGFYCKDPKLSFQFKGDTVPMSVLIAVVYFTPLILISIIEMRACKHLMSETARRVWCWYKEFLLGITIVILITEFAKVVIGEPRPHFLETCRPDSAINCTSGYISSYTCTNQEVRRWLVSDSSKSFPSGHTSLSVFTALFCVWYLQQCLSSLSCKLVKPFVQSVFLIASISCSLSRIADHRHHWWDVLAGAVLGIICAIYTVVVFCKNFQLPLFMKARPSNSTCTLLTDTTNKNATSVVL